VAGLVPDDWLIRAFESSGALIGGCRWIHWRFVEGRTFSPGAYEDRLRRCTTALSVSIRP
jgi:hypothetical protein